MVDASQTSKIREILSRVKEKVGQSTYDWGVVRWEDDGGCMVGLDKDDIPRMWMSYTAYDKLKEEADELLDE